MARSRICSICQKRPVGSGNGSDPKHAATMGYCAPCLEEGEWENTHGDDGHETCPTLEEINDPSAEWSDAKDKENALAVRVEIAECWICHPELNEAQKEYKIRNGSTREGMKIHVTIRASGVTKAEETAAQLDESYEAKVSKPTKRNGQVTKLIFASTAQSFLLSWDHRGRFVTGTVTEAGKTRKLRNVAEAIRLSK
jgi:hypothetical protein